VDIMPKNRSESYFWAYFTKDINNAEGKCKICGNFYILQAFDNIKLHVKKKHKKTSKKQHENSVLSKGKGKWPFSIIQNHQTKCDICGKEYKIYYYESNAMRVHLQNAHNINIKDQNFVAL